MMFQSPPMPTLSCVPPQLLGQLLDVMQTFLQLGHAEAAANLILVAVHCHAPLPAAHHCPLSFPPPSFPSPRRQRRRRRRRSRTYSPGSAFSSTLSADVDALLTSIIELPVTSTIQAELDVEELALDNVNVLNAKARDDSKEVEEVVATMKEEQAAIKVEENLTTKEENRVPDHSAEVWMDEMVNTLGALEVKYTPHPLPYQASEGVLHSADFHPPHVDFSALGFNSRRLTRPELHPVQGCSPDQ